MPPPTFLYSSGSLPSSLLDKNTTTPTSGASRSERISMQADNHHMAYLKGTHGKTVGGYHCTVFLLEKGRYACDNIKGYLDGSYVKHAGTKTCYPSKNRTYPPWTEEKKVEATQRSKRRLTKKIRNAGDITWKAMDTTYATEPVDVAEIRRDVTRAAENYKRLTGKQLNYNYVIERGEKNGRFHVHWLLDCQYIDQKVWQDDIWKKGWVWITAIKNPKGQWGVNCYVDYMLKYISKAFQSDIRGAHRFETSENFPDVSESFRVYHETYKHAELAIEAVYDSCPLDIDVFNFGTESKQLVVGYTCFSPSKETNVLYQKTLTCLADSGDMRIEEREEKKRERIAAFNKEWNPPESPLIETEGTNPLIIEEWGFEQYEETEGIPSYTYWDKLGNLREDTYL